MPSFTERYHQLTKYHPDTLDKLGLEWTHCTRDGSPYTISVARRTSVALLDAHVGPKH